jgi:hypothetical protein
MTLGLNQSIARPSFVKTCFDCRSKPTWLRRLGFVTKAPEGIDIVVFGEGLL